MQEVLEGLCLRAVAQALADKVFDGFDVVIGRRLDLFDALSVVDGEIINDVIQHIFHD